MNTAKLFALPFVLVAGACAGPGATGTTADFDRALNGCAQARRYPDPEMAVINRMRDHGDGLADVVERVGGSRQDVRCAELAFRARRRGQESGSPLVAAGAVASGSVSSPGLPATR
jgi:hypothetical protein